MGIASEVIELVRLIAKWVREGLSDEEIENRLADPASVGGDILKRVEDRKQAGKAYLGRDRD